MLLGEACRRRERLCERLEELGLEIPRVNKSVVHEALIECDDILRERSALSHQIYETKRLTKIEGKALYELEEVQGLLSDEIYFLATAFSRGDLPDPIRDAVYEQLTKLRSTRDNLAQRLEQCIWETDLISSS